MSDDQQPHVVLANLPLHIKNELHKLIADGVGSTNIKKTLMAQFKKESALVDASRSTYDRYIEQNKEQIMKEVELNNELKEDAHKTLDDMGKILENGLNHQTTPEDRQLVFKEALANLERQRKRIDTTLGQSKGVLDSRYESVLVQIERARLETITRMQALEDVFQQDIIEEVKQEYQQWVKDYIFTVVGPRAKEFFKGHPRLEEYFNVITDEDWEKFKKRKYEEYLKYRSRKKDKTLK